MSLINDALKRAGGMVKKKSSEPAEGTPPMEPAPDGGSGGGKSKIVPIVIVLLLLGGGGYFVMSYMSKKPVQTADAKGGTNAPGTNASVAKPAGTNVAAKPAPVALKPAVTNVAAKPGTATNTAKPVATAPRAVTNVVAATRTTNTNPILKPILTAASVADMVSKQNRDGEAVGQNMQVTNPPAVTTPPPAVADATPAPAPAPVVTPTPAPRPPVSTVTEMPASWKLQAIYLRVRNPSAVISGQTVYVGDSVDGIGKVVAIERESVHIAMGSKTNSLSLK